jgi:hypothetical protein
MFSLGYKQKAQVSSHPTKQIYGVAATLNFVIPSAAEFPATLLRDTAACAVFRRRKPHEVYQRHQDQQEIRLRS